jgi:citrate lyase subunit beta / citryl-CoA lyase
MKRKARRVLIFVPGNSPSLLRTATIIDADTIIIDLEDSVSLEEKDSARYLTKQACNYLPFTNKEIAVRVNSFNTPWGYKDMQMISKMEKVDSILLPKATPESVKETERFMKKTNKKIICLIETAFGLQNAYDIATASKRVSGIALGAEDLAVDMNFERTPEGEEILFARNVIALAAHAANVQPIDTPFTAINDYEGLRKDTLKCKSLGFTAKLSISPFHVKIIKEIFLPTLEEVDYSKRVIEAAKEAEKKGLGTIQMDGKMLDLPIVLRAQRIIDSVEGGITKCY